MNLIRFLKKCAFDRPAAIRSARLTARGFYGQWYWFLHPNAPLVYNVPQGGTLLLEPGHSFTGCFWPGGFEYYEPDVHSLLLKFLKPGNTFIDCGANIGYFSVVASALVGRNGKVVSIEANPQTCKLLERNLKVNDFGILVNYALTSQPGEVELFVPSDGDVYSSLSADGLVKNSVECQSVKVKGKSLDEILEQLQLDRVDMVKIDIEGAELDVLQSAPRMMGQLRPVIILEYGTNTWPSFCATPEDLLSLAERFSYVARIFDRQKQVLKIIPKSIWEEPYVNLVLLPQENPQAFN